MARYTFTNKTDQVLDIYYIDDGGEQRTIQIGSKKTLSFQAEQLHPNTIALIDRGKLVSDTGIILTSTIERNSKKVIPISYGGNWISNIYFGYGVVVAYLSKLYICTNDRGISSNSIPPSDQLNWQLFAFSDASAVFDTDLSGVQDGDTLIRSGDGWVVSKISDANITSISIDKVTLLSTVLNSKLSKAGGTMTGALTLAGAPTQGNHAANKSYVDTFLSKAGGTMSGLIKTSLPPVAGEDLTNRAYVDGVIGSALPKAGGTMTGVLTLASAPTQDNHAATKAYADSKLSKAGGTMTGALTLAGAPSQNNHAANKAYVDTFLSKAGGTMTGALLLAGAPTEGSGAANKDYVDTFLSKAGGTMTGALLLAGAPTEANNPVTLLYLNQRLGSHLLESGGSMTGPLFLAYDPTEPLHAVSKSYVDTINTAKLPLTGGVMTGPITGSHGLLPLAAGSANRLTDTLYLKETAGSDGLSYVAAEKTLAYGSFRVFGAVTEVTDDYEIVPNDEVIVANSDNKTILIKFPASSTNFPRKPIRVVGKNFEKNNMVMVSAGTYFLPLSSFGNSVVVVPRGTSWEIADFHQQSQQVRVTASLGAESSNTIDITFKTWVSTPVSGITITGVTQPATSRLAFNIGSTASQWRVGDHFIVTGTSSYNGDYWVHSIDGNNLVVVSSRTYTSTQTGKLSGWRTEENQNAAVMLHGSINSSLLAGEFASNFTATVGNNTMRLYGTSTTGNRQQLFLPAGTGIMRLADTTNAPRSMYLHYAGVSHHAELLYGAIQNVDKLTASVTSILANGSGGIAITIPSATGFKVGDSITISGTGGVYDGTMTVASIAGNVLSCTTSFTSNVMTGLVTSNNVLQLLVPAASAFTANDIVDIERVEAITPIRCPIEAVFPDIPAVLIRGATSNLTLDKSGIIRLAPIIKVTYL